MTRADYDRFTERLNAVGSVYGRRMTEDMTAVYFALLKELPLEAIEHALDRFVRTAETGARFPSPRDLRALAREAGSPRREPTALELGQIRTAVSMALLAWERDEGVGSARPTFDAAWRAACQAERVLPTTHDRERCWNDYLEAGTPAGPGTGVRLFRAALAWMRATRGAPPRASVIAELVKARMEREPGEEG